MHLAVPPQGAASGSRLEIHAAQHPNAKLSPLMNPDVSSNLKPGSQNTALHLSISSSFGLKATAHAVRGAFVHNSLSPP